MFGFVFILMISNSVYVANLTSFLTEDVNEKEISSMQDVVIRGLKVCAPPALEYDLTTQWPETDFVFNFDHPNYIQGRIEYFNNNKAKSLLAMFETSNRKRIRMINSARDS